MFTIPELVYTILALPVVFSILSAMNIGSNTVLHWLNRLTATAVAVAAAQLLLSFDPAEPAAFGYFYLDALGLWMLLIVTALYLAFAWTSKAYLDRDTNIRYGYLRRFSQLEGRFYALSHLFVWTMMLVVLVDNLGLMWVAIEATTLVSALLVAFKFTKTSLEAAWKYVMVCTVGICLALLGTILLYYAQILALGGHLLGPGGRLLAMKGVHPEEEIAALPAGWVLAGTYPLHVPGLDAERHLVEIVRAPG